ncbi:cytochrome P450 [Gonapodya prolifera JEL478]|uniref:Cytochrome P450 n=1 Tax=Gonapodya prolifera (strain JEL478) TaxID=1344416 RepID=A0A139ATR1_GONPJ|nr:cytochrome P450 [Gonapodya prolifera JEL478]|eukprot:KXS20118.1 cytochrome P450 [Gonapodya prolifera JEL478]
MGLAIIDHYFGTPSQSFQTLFLAFLYYKVFEYILYLYDAFVLSPLRNVPGNPWYVIFGQYALFYERYFALGGHKPHVIRNQLHYKYGPVIRVGARAISVCSPELVQEVIVKEDYPKSETARWLFGPNMREALFSIVEKEVHKRLRRLMSGGFSISGVAKMEPLMQTVYMDLQTYIEELIDKNGGEATMDIWTLVHGAGTDILGITTFGRSFDSIRNPHPPIVDFVESTFKYLSSTASLPVIRKIPFLNVNVEYHKKEANALKMCDEIVAERKLPEKKRSDNLQLLVDGVYNDGEKIDRDTIYHNLFGLLVAGADSTAGAMGFTMKYLIQNPTFLTQCQSELDACPVDSRGLISQSVVKSLPFLSSCQKEALRLGTGRDFQRVAPRDVVLGGFQVPAGTEVNCCRYALHRGPWWKNPDEYQPARFGAAGDGDEIGAFAPFSLGTRNCIGKNFAWQEMRVIVANLLRRYEFEDIPGQDEECGIWINLMLKSNKYMCKIRRRRDVKA